MKIDSEEIQSLPWKQLFERVIGIHPKFLDEYNWLAKFTDHLLTENIINIEGYFEYLSVSSYRSPAWRRLCQKLLNNTTAFFRHPDSFIYLEQYVNQKLIDFPENGAFSSKETLSPSSVYSGNRSKVLNIRDKLSALGLDAEQIEDVNERIDKSYFTVWSVGCSTGEESYSLSAAVYNSLEKMNKHQLPYLVMASDIDESAINYARTARYEATDFGREELANWRRFFDHDTGSVFVKPFVSEKVFFFSNSIFDKKAVFEEVFDVVFCQNLLIYFRRWRVREILNRLSHSIASGGLLIVGIGEATCWNHPNFVKISNSSVSAFKKVKCH